MSKASVKGLKRRKTRLLLLKDSLSAKKLLFCEIADTVYLTRVKMDELTLIIRATPEVLKRAGHKNTTKARKLIKVFERAVRDLDLVEELLDEVLHETSKAEVSIAEQIEEIESMLKEV